MDEEEEPKINPSPHTTQADHKTATKQAPEGRLSARKMTKRRKNGESIFQHKHGQKKKSKKKKKNGKEEETIFPDVHVINCSCSFNLHTEFLQQNRIAKFEMTLHETTHKRSHANVASMTPLTLLNVQCLRKVEPRKTILL